MPKFTHGSATIYYEDHGRGFPILTFAPPGLLSTCAFWNDPSTPIHPVTEWSDEFRVICMDQRNAPKGQSRAPITAQDGWHSYTADHVALLNHLQIDRCHLYGQCIGGPFIMSLLKTVPQRVCCAAIAQPTGRVGEFKPEWNPRFAAFAEQVRGFQPGLTDEVLDAFYRRLYGAGFIYSVDREAVRSIDTPLLIMAGNDEGHPFQVSKKLAQLLPTCDFIDEWKTGAALEAARRQLRAFFRKHRPA